MYGLLEGIRGGAADMRAANEQEANQRYREQMLAMQRAAHEQQVRMNDARLRDMDLALRDRQAVSDAAGQLRVLQDQDTAAQNFRTQAGALANEQINAPGGGLPMYLQRGPEAPTERDWLRASTGLAAAKGDVKEMGALRKQKKVLDANDETERLADDPEFQNRALDYIHKNELFPIKITKGAVDPKTGKQLTQDVIEFDTGAQFKLAAGDRRKIARGVALMKAGLEDEGLAQIESVNKQLKEVVQAANQKHISMYQANDMAGSRLRDDKRADEQLAAQTAHWQRQDARAGAQHAAALQAMRMGQVRVYEDPKTGQRTEMYPEITKAGIQWKPVPTPAGMQPYMPREHKPVSEADITGVIGELRADKANKGVPYEQLRAKAQEILTGRGGGGLPDLFGTPPPTSPKKTAIPPGPAKYQRPAENYGPFEAMSDAQLAPYIQAKNELAIEVARRRREAAANERVDTMGYEQ